MKTILKISPTGLALIQQFEGFRAKPYLCPAGKLTVGYGHVVLPRDKFSYPLSKEQANNLLVNDVFFAAQYINATTQDHPPNQNQFDALCSLVFNIGIGNYDKSTLLKKLRVGDFKGAEAEFLRWNKINVHGTFEVNQGLHRRRCLEADLFKTPWAGK